MKIRFLHSFDKALNELGEKYRAYAADAIDSLLSYFETGQRSHGLGLKKLHNHYWEIRIGLKTRILFLLEKDILTFVLIGNHEAIKKFLRNS
jgi:mRNA-degrading endonuclease RelE of RelBE toxin-antitoxin system